MKGTIIAALTVLIAVVLAVSGAYAYNATYSDNLDSQEIRETYATLNTTLTQDITVSDGNLVFDGSTSLTVTYADTNSSKCYLNIQLSGIGAGNVVRILITQTQDAADKVFDGSAVADSAGIVKISGYGLINPGNFSIAGTVDGTEVNQSTVGMTLVAYPQSSD